MKPGTNSQPSERERHAPLWVVSPEACSRVGLTQMLVLLTNVERNEAQDFVPQAIAPHVLGFLQEHISQTIVQVKAAHAPRAFDMATMAPVNPMTLTAFASQ